MGNGDFFEYLYVTGELNKDDSLSNIDIKELYDEYNRMFPDNPIDSIFFFKPQEEQISLLASAIENREPIKQRGI